MGGPWRGGLGGDRRWMRIHLPSLLARAQVVSRAESATAYSARRR